MEKKKEFCSVCNQLKPVKDGERFENPDYGHEFVCKECLTLCETSAYPEEGLSRVDG